MRTRQILNGISPKAWEHPADRAALTMLRQVPGFGEILRRVVGVTTEKSLRLIQLSSSVRVTERQFPRVKTLVREAVAVLDIRREPEVYVSQSPMLSAGVYGVRNPFIVLNSAMLDSLSGDELLAVIGHEIGHLASDHSLYKTLLWLITNVLAAGLGGSPAGPVLLAVVAALREWDRKSELSADRAGLLVVQDPNVGFELLMKLAGGARVGEMNIDEFFLQAAEYEGGGDILDSVHKILNLLWQSHPFPVLRLSELKSWQASGGYETILSGEYRRRENAEPDDILKEFAEASRSYKEDLRKSTDPLARTAAGIGEGLESFVSQADELLKSILKGP